MAQYTIKHRCGHETTEQIYGTDVHGERSRHADALASRLCPACYRTQQQSAAEGRATSLPALTGSDKQVAWALTLRDKQLNDLAQKVQTLTEWVNTVATQYPSHAETLHAAITEFVAAARARTDAKYWIDARNTLSLAADLRDTMSEMSDAMIAEIKAARAAEAKTSEATEKSETQETPAPVVEAAPEPMDAMTAERLAAKAWGRVKSWYDLDEVEETRRALAAGQTKSLLPLISDVLAEEPRRYGPEAAGQVLALIGAQEGRAA